MIIENNVRDFLLEVLDVRILFDVVFITGKMFTHHHVGIGPPPGTVGRSVVGVDLEVQGLPQVATTGTMAAPGTGSTGGIVCPGRIITTTTPVVGVRRPEATSLASAGTPVIPTYLARPVDVHHMAVGWFVLLRAGILLATAGGHVLDLRLATTTAECLHLMGDARDKGRQLCPSFEFMAKLCFHRRDKIQRPDPVQGDVVQQ